MKERNLNHEKRIRSYLFSGDIERHKAICQNLNVKPNIPEENKPNYEKAYHLLMMYFDSIADEEKEYVSKELNKIGL